jgi:hypothetical protein
MKWCVFNLRCNIVPSGVLCNIVNVLLFEWWDQKFDDLLSVTFISLLNWVELVFISFDTQDVERCSEHGVLSSDHEAKNIESFISGSFNDELTKVVVTVCAS